ncbi:type I-E CRISPR-associated protein Cas6/Cse3/CasE [Chelativorans sp. Marseille-P2723]|uniref:type I-E CRISPR-associated protein Cas6/Cse3/CasE n=1 Tax=Chelativorans sp. Marseille-P2723 TaxID=2709133 RepID=UPI00156F420A|nr:type I-E CRISPR-associated protein Cas6/Cse3/CasE [Chelativorans sp. Marseille-P2723]
MNPLHMISLPVDLRELRRLAALHGLGADEGRALHHFLCEAFGKSAVQPFRLMPGRNGSRTATLYGYTGRTAENMYRALAETAPPESAKVFGLEHLSIKSMPESWSAGRRLAFDVRIRPVRRLHKPVGTFARKGAEVDAWLLEALHRFPDGPPEDASQKVRRDQVYAQWLAERLEGAAKLENARMTGMERSAALRNGRSSSGPDVTFLGELSITDGVAFAEKLRRGVGRHTPYGYGMLLLRPA